MKTRALLAALAMPLLAGAEAADSKGVSAGGSAGTLLVVQVGLLILFGRGIGEVMQRIGQPAVIGQLLAGLILGPSLFGWLWPQAHGLLFPGGAEHTALLSGLADIGVLMLLMLAGMETDLRLARKVGRPAIIVTVTGVALPFACGFVLGQFLPGMLLPDPGRRLVASLFLGTALSISSIKIVAMVVREMQFMRRNLGQIIVASAIMEDTIGWIIIAITLGIAGSGGGSALSLARMVLGTALFLVLSYALGRPLVFRLIRWTNDYCVSEHMVISVILLVMLAMALITQLIGVNTVLGGFVAGVLIGQSPILAGEIEDRLRGFITAFLMPIFFGLSGLSADLTILRDPRLALLTIGLVAIASIGKFSGAFLGGRLGGLTAHQSLALGCGMNARGSTEVIVASIGLSMGALSQNLFTMILTMAVITTMAMPLMLRWALARLPVEADESERIHNENLDARGFISWAERLMVAADDSANGKFASSLAGFIAGRKGQPVTVLQVRPQPEAAAIATDSARGAPLADVAREHAEMAGSDCADKEDGAKPPAVDITARTGREDAARAVAEEARKGFDLLFLGLRTMHDAQGAFSVEVDGIAAGFPGPIVLAIAKGGDGGRPLDRYHHILVPVDGTDIARHGAELAFVLARPGSIVHALHVSQRHRRSPTRRQAEQAVLDDVVELGRRYGIETKAAIRVDTAAEDAVLAEASRSRADLLVISAGRRVGDALFLGRTVAAVMEQWPGDMVLLAV